MESNNLERKLAHIETIREVLPHNNADSLEIVKVLGWTCVVLKGQFKVGEQIVFIEPDAILPEGKPEWEFMRSRHFRIKTIKLRGVISQGLVFNACQLLAEKHFPLCEQLGVSSLPYGTDVTELLGITKYQPYIPAQLAGTVKGNFPEFLHRTDEERIQNVPEVLNRYKGFVFSMSEKVDGTSFTCYLNNGSFGVCSRNLELKEDANNTYWKVARELDLENKMKGLTLRSDYPILNFALQGELIGQGIQKNKYLLPNVQLKLFNIFNINIGKYLDQDEFIRVAANLGLDTVPMLGEITLDHTVDQLVELAKGPSKLNPKIPREGIVFRPEHETYDEDLGRLSWKVLNPIYLLEQEE
jgi:RNA ligase (TIGR02306 family)